MDMLANEIDKIEADIQLIPDGSQYKEALMQALKELRTEFEGGISVKETTKLKIAKMSAAVNLYMTGSTDNPMEDLTVDVPELSIDSDIENVEENLILDKESTNISILKALLAKIDYDEEPSQIREAVDLIVKKYDGLKVRSQEVEQGIAGAKYRLMTKYMMRGEREQAGEYAKTLGTDMRIYIVDKLKKKIPALIEAGRLADAERLNAYIYEDAMKESDLMLWETITKIEYPNVEITAPVNEEKSEDKNLPAVKEKQNIFKKMRDKMLFEKWGKYDVKEFVVRYDPTNTETGINIEDVKKIGELAVKKRNKNKMYKIIFEEGITAIDKLPTFIYDHVEKTCLLMPQLIEVEVPKTLKSIADGAFYAFNGWGPRIGFKKYRFETYTN